MMRRLPVLALASLAILTSVSLGACTSSDSTDDSPTMSTEQQIADLDERVSTLEREVRGLRWIARRIIAADPAAVIAALESDVAELEQEFTGAQTEAEDASEAAAEQTQATQEALDAAQKAIDEAKTNINARLDERDALIAEAGAAIAEARDALDSWIGEVADAQGSSS